MSWSVFNLSQPTRPTEAVRIRAQLLAPDSSVRQLPLVVFLHGAGECGNDKLPQLRNLPEEFASTAWRTRFRCYVLAPQYSRGRYWSQHMEEVESLIEHVVQEHQIDRSRIYHTKLSMGGFASWELATRRPDLFAAVVPIRG